MSRCTIQQWWASSLSLLVACHVYGSIEDCILKCLYLYVSYRMSQNRVLYRGRSKSFQGSRKLPVPTFFSRKEFSGSSSSFTRDTSAISVSLSSVALPTLSAETHPLVLQQILIHLLAYMYHLAVQHWNDLANHDPKFWLQIYTVWCTSRAVWCFATMMQRLFASLSYTSLRALH